MALGARIVEPRKNQGLTQGELAEHANVSRTTISKIDRVVQDVGTPDRSKTWHVLDTWMLPYYEGLLGGDEDLSVEPVD